MIVVGDITSEITLVTAVPTDPENVLVAPLNVNVGVPRIITGRFIISVAAVVLVQTPVPYG